MTRIVLYVAVLAAAIGSGINGVRGPRKASSGAIPGNCTDANVAGWLSMDNASGNLVVPSGCAASGTSFVKAGSPTYAVSSGVPQGLANAITLSPPGNADYFATAGDVNSLDPGTSDMVLETWIYIPAIAPGFADIASKLDGDTVQGWEFYIQVSATPALDAAFYIQDAVGGYCQVDDLGVLTRQVWHRIRAAWLYSASTCTMQVDNGTVVSTSLGPVGSVSSEYSAVVGGEMDAGNASIHPYSDFSLADLRITIGNATNDLGFNPNWQPQP